MIHRPLRSISLKPDLQISSGAERLPGAGQNHDLDAIIGVEHGVDPLEVLHHLPCKSIVHIGAVEGHDDDGGCSGSSGRVVGDLDMGGIEGFIRGRDLDGGWIGYHGVYFFV